MTSKTFLNLIANGKSDVVQEFLETLSSLKIDYCVVGGLAVNVYAEPVVSLDLDLVLAIDKTDKLISEIKDKYAVETFIHSINLKHPESDLRIQLQTDIRYQPFIQRAEKKSVLGYEMIVASLVDVLSGKVWAYQDEERRKSKRQKDLADIMRLVETHPELLKLLPENLQKKISE